MTYRIELKQEVLQCTERSKTIQGNTGMDLEWDHLAFKIPQDTKTPT